MKTSTETLLDDLKNRIRSIIADVEKFSLLSKDELSKRPAENAWSALECLEHMNLYGDFYIQEFHRAITQSKYPSERVFTSGWMGDYSAKSMIPKEKLNKMKTFKTKNPLGSKLNKESTIDRFINQQKEILHILEKAKNVSLNRTKCNTTLPLFKFNLGDTLRFVIYHEERHLVQAKKSL